MDEKRLLILGSLEDFTILAQKAVERGIYTVMVDDNEGEAAPFASKVYRADLEDDRLIDQIIRTERIDHVVSSFSDYLFEMMVRISERNGLPCFCPADKVCYLRDKMKMKQMLSELGIDSAPGQSLDLKDFNEDSVQIPYPFVVKPIDGWGSHGMQVVHDFAELKEYAITHRGFSPRRQYALLESINMGYELNLMSWIHNGEIYFLEFGDRETTGMTRDTLPHQSREIFPAVYYRELEDTFKDYAKRIADYCGIAEGPITIQSFYEDGHITIGEVAGRLFGYGQGIVPVINGIDVNDLLLNMLYSPEQNDALLRLTERAFDHCSIALYLLPRAGIVRDLGNVMDYNTENVDEFKVYVRPNISTTHSTWIVRVYAHFPTREAADAYTKDIYENLFVPDLEGKNLVRRNELVVYDGRRWKHLS